MSKWVRRILVALAALGILAAGAVFAGLRMADSKMARTVRVDPRPVAYTTDPAALERGRYLYASRGCADCHGDDGAGRTFVEDAGSGLKVKGPNISPGPGTVVAQYQPQDWVRAIRHGVSPAGRPLLVMPSEDYNRFTDEDLAALVAYVRSLRPASGTAAEVIFPVPVRVMYGFGAIRDAASRIDHGLPPQKPVPEAVTTEHGAYVANMCIGCHGEHLQGGKVPGAPPDWPAAANLTPGPGSVMPAYADAEAMMKMFRTGKRPDGSPVKVMPFGSLKNMSDVDVKALYLYLKTLKPLPKG